LEHLWMVKRVSLQDKSIQAVSRKHIEQHLLLLTMAEQNENTDTNIMQDEGFMDDIVEFVSFISIVTKSNASVFLT